MRLDNLTLAVFIIASYGVSEVLFRQQTIADSTLLTKLRSSTKHSRHRQWSEDVYSSLKNSVDGRNYSSDLIANVLGRFS